MIGTPFVYILKHTRTNRYYIGSRYAKKCDFRDLLTAKGYKTSSKLVHAIIESEGLAAFVIKKIRLFENKNSAIEYEYKLLKRVNASKNDKIININDKQMLAINDESIKLRVVNDRNRYLISKFNTSNLAEIREQLLPCIEKFYTISKIQELTKCNVRILKQVLPELTDKQYIKKAKSLAIDNPITKMKLSVASIGRKQSPESIAKSRETRTRNAKPNKNRGRARADIPAKDPISGNKLGLIDKTDPRWKTGEIVSANKGVSSKLKGKTKMMDSSGNTVLIDKNDNLENLTKWVMPDDLHQKVKIASKMGSDVNKLKKWYTNGTDNIFVNPEVMEVPKTYVLGRTLPITHRCTNSSKNKKWYTNGSHSIFIHGNPPTGYKPGRHARSLYAEK